MRVPCLTYDTGVIPGSTMRETYAKKRMRGGVMLECYHVGKMHVRVGNDICLADLWRPRYIRQSAIVRIEIPGHRTQFAYDPGNAYTESFPVR